MNELKMSFDDMISALDGASGRLTVEALKNPVIKEAKEMLMKVSISLGEWEQDMEEMGYRRFCAGLCGKDFCRATGRADIHTTFR